MPAALREGVLRFPSGVYAVWYPVTERARAETFRASLKTLPLPPTPTAQWNLIEESMIFGGGGFRRTGGDSA